MKNVKITVKKSIEPQDVMYLEASENYTIIHYTTNKQETVPITLKRFEEKLNQSTFYRVHKSFLVNINYVAAKVSRFELEMMDNRAVSISRRKVAGFVKFLKYKNPLKNKSL